MLTFQNLLFGTIYVPCVLGDICDYKVPNQWILAGWLTGLVYRIFTGSWQGLFLWLAGILLPVLILFPLYAFKVLGAGDIKLLSVSFGIYGISAGLCQLIYIGVSGAIGALYVMLRKKQLSVRLAYFKNYAFRFYAGVLSEKGSCISRILSSVKKTGRYYDKERDGCAPAMHFTVFTGLGIILWEVLGYE